MFPSTAVKLCLLFYFNLKVIKVLIAIAHMKGQAMNGPVFLSGNMAIIMHM